MFRLWAMRRTLCPCLQSRCTCVDWSWEELPGTKCREPYGTLSLLYPAPCLSSVSMLLSEDQIILTSQTRGLWVSQFISVLCTCTQQARAALDWRIVTLSHQSHFLPVWSLICAVWDGYGLWVASKSPPYTQTQLRSMLLSNVCPNVCVLLQYTC